MSDLAVPQAIRAERAVLGAVFRDPKAIDSIAEWLTPKHCYLERNAWVLEAMLHCHAERNPPDRVFVAAELEAAGRLAAVGGELYLIELMGEVPHAAHIERHARLVEHAAVLRWLIEAGGKVAALGYEGLTRDLDEVIADVERELAAAVAGRAAREKATAMRAVMGDLMDRIQSANGRGGLVGVPSGYPDLDALTGGFQNSDLILLAARPSLGKTSLALSLAYNVALAHGRDRTTGEMLYLPGLSVGVFSLEMSRDQLGQRLLAMHTGLDMQRIRTGNLREDEMALAFNGMGHLSLAPIVIDDTPGLSIRDLQRRARRMHTQHALSLLFVDYLQLMGGGRAENRVQEVSEISRGLKALARELDVPVIALSQLSRAVEGRQSKVPMLSDLRESGSLEQDADIVMFIYRDDYYDKHTDKKGIAELHISKHRNGPLGVVPLRFEGRTTRFHTLDRYVAPEGYGPADYAHSYDGGYGDDD